MGKINSYNVCFLGRTGNGKSTLINALFGTDYPTDPLVSCTKKLYSVTILEEGPHHEEAITILDTPGIGEFSSDSKYDRYYQHAVSVSDCIILVSTFDRTDAPAQRLLLRLKKFIPEGKDVKFIIALNHIDSKIIGLDANYVAWDEETNSPSSRCLKFIEERINGLHEKFDNKFLPFEVVPVCALRTFGIENLRNSILK